MMREYLSPVVLIANLLIYILLSLLLSYTNDVMGNWSNIAFVGSLFAIIYVGVDLFLALVFAILGMRNLAKAFLLSAVLIAIVGISSCLYVFAGH